MTFARTDLLGVYTVDGRSRDPDASPSTPRRAAPRRPPRRPAPRRCRRRRQPRRLAGRLRAGRIPGRRSGSRSTCSTSASRRSPRATAAKISGLGTRPRVPGTGGRRRPPSPTRATRSGSRSCSLALLVLTLEWLVYERDTLARLRRAVASRLRGSRPRGAGRLMGISFDQPLALLLLVRRSSRRVVLHLSSRRRLGVGRRRAALAVRRAAARAAGRRARRVPAGAPGRPAGGGLRRRPVRLGGDGGPPGGTRRSCATACSPSRTRTSRASSRSAATRWWSGCRRSSRDIDRIASTPLRDATDIGGALRLAGALFPDDAQKRIVLLSDGNDTTGSRPDRGGPRGGPRDPGRDALVGLDGADEVLVERLTSPSTARIGEKVQVSADVTSTVAQPATVRLFVNGELAGTQDGRPRPPARTGWTSCSRPRTPGSCASGSRSRPPATRSTRTTARIRTRSSRASRGCSWSRATRTSRPSSSRRSRPSATRSTRSSPRRSRRTSRGSRTTTPSCSSTCPGSGSRTRRWPRSRCTSGTWDAGS